MYNPYDPFLDILYIYIYICNDFQKKFCIVPTNKAPTKTIKYLLILAYRVIIPECIILKRNILVL